MSSLSNSASQERQDVSPMPYIPKAPASCISIGLALVERTLTKHQANVALRQRSLAFPVQTCGG